MPNDLLLPALELPKILPGISDGTAQEPGGFAPIPFQNSRQA
jgi:hypothetical protein